MNITSSRSFFLLFAAAGFLSAQTLSVDKSTLTFAAQSNGSSVSQTVNIASSASFLGFSLASNASWLSTNPAIGQAPTTVTVTANPLGLAPQIYTGTITVLGGQGTAPTITVTFNVGSIGVTPSTLTFNYQQGTSNTPAAQALGLSGQPTGYTAAASTASGGNWLQISSTGGSSPGTINVTINAGALAGLTPNTYQGKVTITPTTSSGAPIEIPVSLVVTAAPEVSVTPSSANLVYQNGGANNNPQQTLTLSAKGAQPVSFAFVNANPGTNPQNKNWITFSPATGTIPANGSTTVTIGYNSAPPDLTPNNYAGSIQLNTTGQPAQITIPINLQVSTQPLLNVTAPDGSLAFNYQVGGTLPAAKSVTATSTNVAASSTTGQMTLALAATSTGGWLTLPSTSGITGTPFSVTVNPVGLAPGNYSGSVTVTGVGAGNGPQTIPVTLTVANDPQVTATVGGCTTFGQGCSLQFPVQIAQVAPAAQTVRVSSSTGATLNYTATRTIATCGSVNWLQLSGVTSGSTENSFTVAVDRSNLDAGSKCEGSVTITATNAVGGASTPNTITIPVTMYVSNTALLSVTPLALNFTAQVQQAAQPQAITVNSTSPTEVISFSVTTETPGVATTWLLAPSSGTTPTTLNIVVVPGSLSPGTYSGKVRITAAGATVANSPIDIPVTLTVTGSNMSVTPASLSFEQTAGGAAPATQNITLASSAQAINWTASISTGGTGNWLTISPASGSATSGAPSAITVTANGTALSPGTYNGTVTFTSTTPFTGGSPASVNVTLVVAPGTISATPSSLNFSQLQGGAAPAAQTISVAGTPGSLNYTVTAITSSGSGWLSAGSSSGSTPGTVSITVNGASLTPGAYTGTVRITASGTATGSPIDIPVTLTVAAPQSVTATPSTLTFNHTIGNSPPAAQTVQLQASGGAAAFTVTTSVTGGGTWLSVTPASGTTPSALAVSVNPSGLAAGSYTGTINVVSPVSSAPVAASITVNLVVIATVPPALTAVRNAGSYAAGPISAGENIVLFGSNLGPAELVKGTLNAAGAFNTTLGETQVTFDGIAAPILYAWGPQTSVMVPYEVAGRVTVTMRVIYKGVQSDSLQLSVAGAAPGIYTLNQSGSGPGAIVNQNGSYNADAPAPKGSVVAVYMTGEGTTSPQPANGSIAPVNGTGLFKPILPVTATVGGIPARVLYYGSAPGIVYGVMQVNVEIPDNAPSGGAVPIQISVGTTPTQNGVTVAVQ